MYKKILLIGSFYVIVERILQRIWKYYIHGFSKETDVLRIHKYLKDYT